MAIRPHRFSRGLTLGWLLGLAVAGCGGGQPAAEPAGDSTTDVTRPRIIATSPTDREASVPVNAIIAVEFSEEMNAGRLDLQRRNLRFFQFVNGTVQEVQLRAQPLGLVWESRSDTLFITPATLLPPNTHFTVTFNDGWRDVAGNFLDTGSPDNVYTWRFTTSDTYDDQKPVWNPNRKVLAVPDRYDTVTVCWWNDDPPTTATTCDGIPTSPAAYDLPGNVSTNLIYTVEYKRDVDAGFSSIPSKVGEQSLKLEGLVASSNYEIQLRVHDLAGNESDEIITADLVRTPPAGRLYVANQVANSLSVIPDIAQVQGDQASALVTAGRTQLVAPTGIAVDQGDPNRPDDDLVYVADPSANMIAAYKLRSTINNQPVQFGEYGIGHNLEPEWTIQGTLTATDITQLCGPSTLRLQQRLDGRKILYVANSLALPNPFAPVCLPQNILAFDITQAPQGPNQPPIATLAPGTFRGPLGFAVDEGNKLLYVANRDDFSPGDRTGWSIQVFGYGENIEDLDSLPHRTFWGTTDGPCLTPATEPSGRICGPTALAFDGDNTGDTNPGGRLFVVNREKSNILIFSEVINADRQQTPIVVEGPNTGLDGARPTGIFVDPDPLKNRVYVTTDAGQSLLIFAKSDMIAGGNITPLRVIKGTRTLLGQPVLSPAFPSHGPFAVTVVDNAGVDEAYVVTPGLFDAAGLTPIPNIAVFDVSVGQDSLPLNTPPDRVLLNPLLGPTGMALDLQEPQRLYVASFHANMILVYDNPNDFVTGLKAPDRIIAGPLTRLDHPVALYFRRDSFEQGALYVVNQSSHSVAVFQEGDGTSSPLLTGNVSPSRYLGPADPTNPFSTQDNLTEMVFPTGLAIDPDHDILYVSNRDARVVQDLVGRRIVAFKDASSVAGNVAPTWKIEGDDPPPRPCTVNCLPVTDKTTLKRPAGLVLIPDPDPGDAVADDRLVVANRDNNSVLIFRGLSALVDAADGSPQPPDDNQAPAWTIAHSSFISPFGVAFDAGTKDLYVSNISDATNSRILVFNLASLVVDTPAPSLQPRVVQGSSTGLLTPHGLALDPQLAP
ncbi:MAG: Ig-like domain-containing protein [Nitrospirota bacterium]